MKVLALDMSTKTGWSVFEDGVTPSQFGLITKDIDWAVEEYPKNFVTIATHIAQKIGDLIATIPYLTDIVIEETNKTGRFGSRHSQKILEFIHFAVVDYIASHYPNTLKIHYVNTSDWRKTLKLSVIETKKLAKPFLKEQARLKKELDVCTDRKQRNLLKENLKKFNEQLKVRCIHGKIDKKSISVAYANAVFGLSLKKGDNDISDSICLGKAFLLGAPTLSNKMIFEKPERN